MIAAKNGDPVLGVDIHAVALPPPAAVPPTPLPHLFIGMVFDPLGAALGGAKVAVNGSPCANTGTGVRCIPHIFTPPGVSFHPSDTTPANEGTLVTGSKTVLFAGSSESRTTSTVISCSFPLGLPTSVCMSVPLGAPVLIGGPEAMDFAAAAFATVRTKWASETLGKFLNPKGGKYLAAAICFLTGHPVDVVSGELIAEATDFELPGLIPVVWDRNYRSRQTRDGALGPGWFHPFDMRVEESPQGLQLWLRDGRPREYRTLAKRESEWDAVERHSLERTDAGYELRTKDGLRYLFRQVAGARHFALVEVRDRATNALHLRYERGFLVQIIDTADRELAVRWTRLGRIEGIYVGNDPLVRYAYDAEGRLAAAIDPLGHALSYEYRGGVMVKETHRSGLAFFFEWDWYHPEGWCTRTWGENPLAASQPGHAEAVPRFIYDRKITYDKHRHFTSVEDGRGGVTQYLGNELGLVEKEIDPSGSTSKRTWNQDCRKLSETDGNGHTSSWEYDDRGNCVVERDPLGGIIRSRYDADDQLVEIVDASGGRWHIAWDRHGRPSTITNPLGVATRYSHDERGRLLRVEDPMGRGVRMSWTSRHDLESVTDGENRTTIFEYDLLGRVLVSRDPLGRTERAQRDAMGRIRRLELANGERLTLDYDVEGNVVEQTDSRGRTERMAYQAVDKLVEHTDAMGQRMRLAYDVELELAAVANRARERYRFERDHTGRLKRDVGFDGRAYSYIYDKAGQVTKLVGPDHTVITTEFDALGRVAKRTLKAPPAPHDLTSVRPRVEEESFAYDERGDLIAVRRADASVTFERDALGQIVREHHLDGAGDVRATVESRYDHSGCRVERETTLGHLTRYTYDNVGDVTQIGAGISPKLLTSAVGTLRLPAFSLGEWEARISRNPLGEEIARRLPGGVVGIWKRDVFGRPAEREILSAAAPGRTPREVQRVGYQWSAPQELGGMVDAQRGTTRFEHDATGSLVAAFMPGGSVEHRARDAASNLFKTAELSDRRYGAGGVLERANGTEYRYDGHGNLIEKVLADGARWKYGWSVSGRLTEVIRPDGKRVSFTYDALGRRVRKEFGDDVTEYVWDGDDLVHERTAMAGKLKPLVTWIFEPRTFAPVAKIEGRRRFSVLTDHRGVPTMLMTEAGQLAWKAQLDIYGVVHEEHGGIAEADVTTNPWRQPGQYEDKETGLYYNRFRYYDPEAGRYISQDPIGLDGGAALYGYVEDPLSELDPLGLKKCNIPGFTKRLFSAALKALKNVGKLGHIHHIVMEGVFDHWHWKDGINLVKASQKILAKHDISLHRMLNLVAVENEKHSKEYATKVFKVLEEADKGGKKEVIKAMKEMRELIKDHRF